MPDNRAPDFLDRDGSASVATALMMSHHAFRRDIAQFDIALGRLAGGDHARIGALREEWRRYHMALHGHHEMEDKGIFPNVRSQNAALATVLDGLGADHRKIDPLLEEGDRAFADLPASITAARGVVSRLMALLGPHLATEEEHLVPALRAVKQFPPPASEAELAMYADGFAWSSHGVADDVLQQVYAMLPEALVTRLPAARAAFARRCEEVWGTAQAGASRTPIPDWLTGARS